MTSKTLHLFPDTNLFAQCRALEELDWNRWGDFDEVRLIVSRPVQAEIDRQKNKGSDRLARRAKTTSSVFREIILSPLDHKVVGSPSPTVKLFILNSLKPDPTLKDQLDYEHNDDVLVGIAHAFANEHPGEDVRVLTHDTGPMASAKMVGVTIAPIPDEWLLEPESTEKDKIIKALETKIKQLERSEPEIKIACADVDQQQLKRLEGEVIVYQPLTSSEVSELMGKISRQFPMVTDFTTPSTPTPNFPQVGRHSFSNSVYQYEPPSKPSVARYRDKLYPAWISQCESILKSLHHIMQAELNDNRFAFYASNTGSRPAKDVLVTVKAKGNFEIVTREKDDDEPLVVSEFQPPPTAPVGTWIPQGSFALSALTRAAAMAEVSQRPLDLLGLHSLHNFRDHKRDPNKFFWKPRPDNGIPVPQFIFECAQWRHGGAPECFWGYIWFNPDQDMVSGALECEIQAENLTSPAKLLIPVRLSVERKSILSIAEEKVALLLRSGGFRFGTES
ncbi:PIN domain-containing protein [Bradyrhizobium sp. USDA 4454]